jgi:hypothetical protein
MRQDISESVNRMDRDARIDVAITFNFLTDSEKAYVLAGGTDKKILKPYIKQRAYADEDIAEYVLLY